MRPGTLAPLMRQSQAKWPLAVSSALSSDSDDLERYLL